MTQLQVGGTARRSAARSRRSRGTRSLERGTTRHQFECKSRALWASKVATTICFSRFRGSSELGCRTSNSENDQSILVPWNRNRRADSRRNANALLAVSWSAQSARRPEMRAACLTSHSAAGQQRVPIEVLDGSEFVVSGATPLPYCERCSLLGGRLAAY